MGALFADGGAEAAGAAVGDGVVEPRVARLQDNVQQLLLGDGVADLHRPAADLLGLRGQTGRGERRTVDAVAPRPAADGDDQGGRTCRLLSAVYRAQADAPAEDERGAEVALAEADGPER